MWKKIKSKTILIHPRVKIVEDTVFLPNGIKTEYLKIIGTAKNGITILCFKGNKVLIQKEYSYPINKILFQFPGGKVEKRETIVEAAKRELSEESGILGDNFKKIGWYYVDNRRNNTKMHVFTTNYVDTIKKNGGDQEENIQSMWISLNKFSSLIKKGKIVTYSALSAWAFFKNN